MQPVTVTISSETIKLGQFIKLASLVETGGAAKEVIADGRVTVNGATDTRRGKTLHDGDVVCVDDMCAQVQVGLADDDYFDEATANDDFDPEQWRNM